MVAHHHLLCLTFKQIKNRNYPLIKLTCSVLPFPAVTSAWVFVKKMLIKLGFIRVCASSSPVCSFVVLKKGEAFGQ